MPRRIAARGFTYIELAITVAIIALLATVALPLAELAVQRTKEQELRTALRQIREAIDGYKQAVDDGRIPKKVDESGYPKSLDQLYQGVDDIKNPNKAKMYFMRRLPRDPFHSDGSVRPEDTWGKRTYSSPPDDPRDGPDVYDVYSLAPGTGLNGVPYKEW